MKKPRRVECQNQPCSHLRHFQTAHLAKHEAKTCLPQNCVNSNLQQKNLVSFPTEPPTMIPPVARPFPKALHFCTHSLEKHAPTSFFDTQTKTKLQKKKNKNSSVWTMAGIAPAEDETSRSARLLTLSLTQRDVPARPSSLSVFQLTFLQPLVAAIQQQAHSRQSPQHECRSETRQTDSVRGAALKASP